MRLFGYTVFKEVMRSCEWTVIQYVLIRKGHGYTQRKDRKKTLGEEDHL